MNGDEIKNKEFSEKQGRESKKGGRYDWGGIPHSFGIWDIYEEKMPLDGAKAPGIFV